jgi:hypothetical protein
LQMVWCEKIPVRIYGVMLQERKDKTCRFRDTTWTHETLDKQRLWCKIFSEQYNFFQETLLIYYFILPFWQRHNWHANSWYLHLSSSWSDYHNIHSFANSRSDPKHLELYFYDDDPSLEHRYHRCRKETYEQYKHVVGLITGILRNNTYSKQFRSLGQAKTLTITGLSWTLTIDWTREDIMHRSLRK